MSIGGWMEPGWQGARPLLDGLMVLLAFLAGALVAVRLRSVRARSAPGHPSPPARPAAPPAAPGSPACALAFGHELKNYLCTIKGSTELLRLATHGKEQADIIDRIDRVVERLETIALGDIASTLSAAPDVLSTRTRETLDLASMARASVRLHFSRSPADFPCHVPEPLPPVQGDPHRLEQVFRNLYGNALEAGAATVSTRFRRIGGELEIAVEDDGCGSPEEIAGRIFEPFFSTKVAAGPVPGAGQAVRGLGLFVVRTIVENHGGRIRATTKNGRGDGGHGLVIYINLPVFTPAGLLPSQIPPPRSVPAGTSPAAIRLRSAA